MLSFTYIVLLYCVLFYVFLKINFWVLLYFITFTAKYFVTFALAVAAVSAELRAILQNKMFKILQFLCCFINSAHDSQFWAGRPIVRKIMCMQNRRILTSLSIAVAYFKFVLCAWTCLMEMSVFREMSVYVWADSGADELLRWLSITALRHWLY